VSFTTEHTEITEITEKRRQFLQSNSTCHFDLD